jgi:hypothetical protein
VSVWGRSASDLRRSLEGNFVPASFINDPEHWRPRADEAHSLADDMKDEISRQMMLQIADYYEHPRKACRTAGEALAVGHDQPIRRSGLENLQNLPRSAGRARPLDALDLARSRLHQPSRSWRLASLLQQAREDRQPCKARPRTMSHGYGEAIRAACHRDHWPHPVWSRVCGRG